MKTISFILIIFFTFACSSTKEERCMGVSNSFKSNQCFGGYKNYCDADEKYREQVLKLSKEIYDSCIANYEEK